MAYNEGASVTASDVERSREVGTMGGERNHSLSLAVASTAVATSYPSFRLNVIVDTIDTGGKHTVSLASVYLEDSSYSS